MVLGRLVEKWVGMGVEVAQRAQVRLDGYGRGGGEVMLRRKADASQLERRDA
jgi:hypothetical protein